MGTGARAEVVPPHQVAAIVILAVIAILLVAAMASLGPIGGAA